METMGRIAAMCAIANHACKCMKARGWTWEEALEASTPAFGYVAAWDADEWLGWVLRDSPPKLCGDMAEAG